MDRDTFLFGDKIKQIESSFVKDGWATIYENQHSDNSDQTLIYCCIVDSKRIKSYKLNCDWVIQPGSEGKPTISETFINGKSKTIYQTHSEKGIEPFIFSKHFSFGEGYDSYLDISEEFVLYFKLYEKGTDKKNRKYYFIDDIGDLDEVISIGADSIKIKLKYLKEYISIRKVFFSICFDFMRYSNGSLTELKINPIDENFKTANSFYNHLIQPIDFIEAGKIQSWIHGKIIINFDKNKTNSCHFDYENYKYEEFITGYDNEGNEILKNCKKANGKYFILTYFKKEVLDKYYNEPSKYKVDGWHVSSNFFSLKIDNNIEDYVSVFLVELGMLPHKEQLHWKQYNIAPQKGISQIYYKTMIEGSWAEHPETPDLFFKHKYEQFNKHWENKFGWKFYKELANEDKHIFTSLHIPTSNNVKAFCEQILAMVKITIDRLNEAELQKHIAIENKDKGITKLEKFLKLNGVEKPQMIFFLRNLWDLRSGLLAHSFSNSNIKCKKAIKYFGINEHNYMEVSRDIFIKSIYTMNTLENMFLVSK
ncbi:MAG: hypothetical protein ABIJ40_07090 [Bacteroidota bacterium]